MKLIAVRLKNFRGYVDSGWISVANLTVFVGRNDAGKSTVLDALDVFFNGKDAGCPIGINDVNATVRKSAVNKKVAIEIACRFGDLPSSIELDKMEKTTFADEGLSDDAREIEIGKLYVNGGEPKAFLTVRSADYGTKYRKIFTFGNPELKSFAESLGVSCENRSSNVCLRRSIRRMLMNGRAETEQRFEFSGDRLTALWKELPRFEIFRADRPNNADDDEAQNPVKLAIRRAFDDVKVKSLLEQVEHRVRDELRLVMDLARDKMAIFDKSMVKSLTAEYPKSEALKWSDVFRKVSFRDQNGVSVDKRGSGVRRLLLMSFFQSQVTLAEEQNTAEKRDVIYAVEEPETAQHADNQVKIAETLHLLSGTSQVLLSTHSGLMLKHLSKAKIWVVDRKTDSELHEIRDDVPLTEKRYMYPVSLVEISYLMLGDCIVEYHEELFGYLAANKLWQSCDSYCVKLQERGCRKHYKRTDETKEKMHGLPLYVRDTLHHPENTNNKKATMKEMRYSIDLMRRFIENKGLKELECRRVNGGQE